MSGGYYFFSIMGAIYVTILLYRIVEALEHPRKSKRVRKFF